MYNACVCYDFEALNVSSSNQIVEKQIQTYSDLSPQNGHYKIKFNTRALKSSLILYFAHKI